MQNRQPVEDQDYFLYVTKEHETPNSVPESLDSTYNTGVILYPDPDDLSSSTSGARKYKACFIKNRKMLFNTIGELIEVSMGNQILHEGFIPKDANNFAELIKKAYDEKLKHKKLILADMQRTLRAYDGPRYKNACKQKENAATQALIDHLATVGVEEPEVKSTEVEHKQPQITPQQDNQYMDYPSDVVIIEPSLPKEVNRIILAYADNDFENLPTRPSYAQFKFFNMPYLDLLHSKVTKLANMMERGEEEDVMNFLDEVKNERGNTTLFDTKVMIEDRWGALLTGNLLEILFKLGDLELVKKVVEIGGVSKEKVVKASECLTSPEAILANDERKKRYKKICIQFGESIYQEVNKEETFKTFKEQLQKERKKEVRLGLVFDPSIIQEAVQCFSKYTDYPLSLFSYAKSDILWVNGIGTLQSMLSTSDAQVVFAGIDDVVNGGIIPPRTLKKGPHASYYKAGSYKLGINFYYGPDVSYPRETICRSPFQIKYGEMYETLTSRKNNIIEKLCHSRPFKTSL